MTSTGDAIGRDAPAAASAGGEARSGRCTVELGGIRTSYLDVGEGPAIVALHGFPTSSALFEPLVPQLAGRRLVAPDLLGQGETEEPTGRLDHAAYAAHLAAFLDSVAPPVFDLLVHDYGGILGLTWAAEHRHRIRRLVVLSTAAAPTVRWSLLCAAAWAFEATGGARAVRAGILRTAKRPGAVAPGTAAGWARPFTRRRVLRGADHFARRNLARVASALPRLSMPALVVWGERDEVFPPSHARALVDALPRARLVTLPEAGHWSPLDDPAGVGAHVAPFLGTVLLLMGPKGSGKSHVGELLQRARGVPFLRVEPIFLDHLRRGGAAGTALEERAYADVLGAVQVALRRAPRVVIESTGASDAFPSFLDALRSRHEVKLVAVRAPLERCRERVRRRDASVHIPVSDGRLDEINARAAAVALPWDVEIDNGAPASADEILRQVDTLT